VFTGVRLKGRRGASRRTSAPGCSATWSILGSSTSVILTRITISWTRLDLVEGVRQSHFPPPYICHKQAEVRRAAEGWGVSGRKDFVHDSNGAPRETVQTWKTVHVLMFIR
jgi:hypothetical protein